MASWEVVKRAKCGCCGMWEECTIGYIVWVQERLGGVWVCGLCEEAVKDEQQRLGVGVDMALRAHALFREAANADPDAQIAPSIGRLIKKIMSSSSSTYYTTSSTSNVS
ncbi:hypothetical protein HS088_TW15G00085 [Tripterygium wilfordii]|uniref:Uncharacterized protein n=1 Tax=Tripterygium wilfordii TaxID=458696 RepID=A0A7J7CKK0_TRIWF|nr:uncharacterized protein LOC120016709 [Tripterygium wilfordii]KAF5734593.1 hypothetical protein HS088_TW15G00085 [Tripterygium wilfordii]